MGILPTPDLIIRNSTMQAQFLLMHLFNKPLIVDLFYCYMNNTKEAGKCPIESDFAIMNGFN